MLRDGRVKAVYSCSACHVMMEHYPMERFAKLTKIKNTFNKTLFSEFNIA